MTDTYNQLKNELSVLYPDVTDIELNEITNNLINFFTTEIGRASCRERVCEFV